MVMPYDWDQRYCTIIEELLSGSVNKNYRKQEFMKLNFDGFAAWNTLWIKFDAEKEWDAF